MYKHRGVGRVLGLRLDPRLTLARVERPQGSRGNVHCSKKVSPSLNRNGPGRELENLGTFVLKLHVLVHFEAILVHLQAASDSHCRDPSHIL